MVNPFKKQLTSSSSFSPSDYCILFDEVMEVKESRENFFTYLREESLCGECVDFLRDFLSFSQEFQRVKNLAGIIKKNILNDKSTGAIGNEVSNEVGYSVGGAGVAGGSEQYFNDEESSNSGYSSNSLGKEGKKAKMENIGVVLSAIKKLYGMADAIITMHVESRVLNVPSWVLKETNNYWNEVLRIIREMILENEIGTTLPHSFSEQNTQTISLLEGLNEGNIDPWLMIKLVTPSKLLLRIKETVLIDLKLDTFARYSRSEYLHQFLEKMGETFTQRIAIRVDELSDSASRPSTSSADVAKPKRIRLRSDDWLSNSFSKEFIFSCLYYAEDSPRWKQIMQANQKPFPQSRFITENDFVMGKNSSPGQKCSKIVMDIPYNRDFVYALYSSSVQRIELDPWMKDMTFYGITKNEHGMTTTASETVFSIGPLQKRSMTILGTNMYDPDADCFMFFFKTKEFEEYQRTPNTTPAECFMVFLFYKVTDNLTRFVNVFFGDLKLPFTNDFTFKIATNFGAKKINKLLEKVAVKYLPQYEEFERLNGIKSYFDFENPTDYIDYVFKFEDDLKFYETIKQNLTHFPVKSWHREFSKEMKESR